MKGLLNFVKSAISEDNNNPSTMRILSFIIVLVLLGNWTYINIKTGQLNEFDINSVLMVAGSLVAKVMQKKNEN